ncbi:Helicase PriA essential for oriC/DnaA-independent DNA replication, partial [uncultured Gammaproteobacteria bacterium]
PTEKHQDGLSRNLGSSYARNGEKSRLLLLNLYLQSVDRKSLHQMLATLNQHTKILTLKNKVRWYLDIDPIE